MIGYNRTIMTVEDIRKRLETLNRGPVGGRVIPASALPAGTDRPRRAPAFDLETLIPGAAVAVGASACYLADRNVSAVWAPGGEIYDRFASAFRDSGSAVRADAVHESLGACVSAGDSALLFVDLETCGFSGTPVFLIGLLFVADGGFQVVQLLARDHSEEPAILENFARHLDERPHLVTFNGKTFDWPFLADRATHHRIKLRRPTGHCDLLHVARRCYRKLLPDCKLQTLERHICGRRRYDDVPGSEIPGTYHHFVRTGDATRMRDVLHHNFLDLVTTADVMAAMLRSL
ncbi:MAG: ribonuclease H-like domain-containing protein [Phycisphaerales bacterium]|nr:ribonuclease H-like domain-containing protein [Phycisphaerales bacterium]